MRTIIYSNMFPFFSLLALLVLMRRDQLFDKKQSKLFHLAIMINLMLLAVISLDYLFARDLAELQGAWIYRTITSCLNFTASPFIPLLLYIIFTDRNSQKELPRFWFYLPFLLNSLLCFASMFWQLVFHISPENTYGRGPFFFVPFLTGILYITMLIYRISVSRKKGKASENIFLLIVIAMLAFCMYLEIANRFFFLTWAGAAIYLVLYYLLININNSSRDPLTGAFNRAVYMKALSEIDRSISCTIAMLDINNFKQINDVQGHAAGDQYLVNFVGILQEEMEKGTSLYRVGGDEFVVLSKKWDEGYLRQRLEHAREQAQIHHLSFAYGTISYQPSDILDDVLILADQKMYRDKKQMKRQ